MQHVSHLYAIYYTHQLQDPLGHQLQKERGCSFVLPAVSSALWMVPGMQAGLANINNRCCSLPGLIGEIMEYAQPTDHEWERETQLLTGPRDTVLK